MKYMGSKAKIAKELLPLILNGRGNAVYVEPFCGGCNMIDKVSGPRIAADINPYLIALFKAVVSGSIPPTMNRDCYNHIRANKGLYEDWLVGWAGFGCSYSGKFFAGYAGVVNTKGGVRDYMSEARNALLKQAELLAGVSFNCASYHELNIPNNAIVYCDIPYIGTTEYANPFNHGAFYDWARERAKAGNKVFVSEYTMPEDFTCIWEKEVVSSLSANGKAGASKASVERLFCIY